MVGGNEMKSAFIVSINWGYMFALNCNFNAMKYFKTDADFHMIYFFPEMNERIEEYMQITKDAFPFNVFWSPMKKGTDYFNAKYDYVDSIKESYDSACIIDGDLFLCCNMNEYFDMAYTQDKYKIITATHLYSGIKHDDFYWGDEHLVTDRCRCSFADFPVFFNPKKEIEFIHDWFSFTQDYKNTERSHPLIAMNRAIAKHYTKDDVLPLDGKLWVNDMNFWTHEYKPYGSNRLSHEDGVICAIHNRWWQHGRANGEIRRNKGHENLPRGIRNFNIIKSYMEFFNNLTPSTRMDNYVKGTIS